MVSQDLFKVVDHSSMHDTSTVTDYVEPESKFLTAKIGTFKDRIFELENSFL